MTFPNAWLIFDIADAEFFCLSFIILMMEKGFRKDVSCWWDAFDIWQLKLDSTSFFTVLHISVLMRKGMIKDIRVQALPQRCTVWWRKQTKVFCNSWTVISTFNRFWTLYSFKKWNGTCNSSTGKTCGISVFHCLQSHIRSLNKGWRVFQGCSLQ